MLYVLLTFDPHHRHSIFGFMFAMKFVCFSIFILFKGSEHITFNDFLDFGEQCWCLVNIGEGW